MDVTVNGLTQDKQQLLDSVTCSHMLEDTCVGIEVTECAEELSCVYANDVVGECLSGGAAAPCDCTVCLRTVSCKSECVDGDDVHASIRMNFTGEANMPAVTAGEDQYDDFGDEVIIEEWVFFDEGEEKNSSDVDGLVRERTLGSQGLTCSETSGFEGNVCPKSGIEEGSLIGASALDKHCIPMEGTGGSEQHTTSNVGTHHVFDPGEEVCVIAMNRIRAECSSIGFGCWPSRLEQCCRDQQLGRAVLRDGLHLQSGCRFADTGKPVFRLRGGGSVPRKRGCRKSCGGRRIKPPAKRQ